MLFFAANSQSKVPCVDRKICDRLTYLLKFVFRFIQNNLIKLMDFAEIKQKIYKEENYIYIKLNKYS